MHPFSKIVELGPSKSVGTEKKPKFEYLEPRLTVKLQVLTAEESMLADDYVGESISQARAFKTYALCSIREINGKPVHPLANQIEFNEVREHFSMLSIGALVREFSKFTGEAQESGNPKDSSGAQLFEGSAEA